MNRLLLLAFVAFAYGVAGVIGQDCSSVDCSTYDTWKIKYGSAGRQECRWKIIDGGTEKRSGLELFTYAMKGDAAAPNTRLCKHFKQVMTAAPKPSDGFTYFHPGSEYDKCCAPKVMDYCFFEVRLDGECGDDATRTDDKIKEVIVNYKNKGKMKGINVKLNPKGEYLECRFSYKGKDVESKTVRVEMKGDTTYRVLCGDNDLKVSIRREVNGAGQTQLKVSREQCLSQYVAMFKDDEGRWKFTTRTALEKNDVYVDGASMRSVLGKTSTGWCGAIVADSYMT